LSPPKARKLAACGYAVRRRNFGFAPLSKLRDAGAMFRAVAVCAAVAKHWPNGESGA